MGDKKLIIPKGDGTLEMAIASLEIYYQYNDWLPNDLFREKLIKKYPDFKDRDNAFLLHKARTARYFGFIEYLYRNKDEIQGRQGRITIEGKRFYEGYLVGNKLALIDTVMHCIDKYTFGRNNYGVEGNSNVEMPSVLLKASLDLEYISKEESIAILYYMHDKEIEYEDAIKRILELRYSNTKIFNDIPEGLGIENRYGDNKAAQLMREIGIFEENTSEYKLTQIVRKNYYSFIKELNTKIYDEEDINTAIDKMREEEGDYERNNKKPTQKIYFGPPGTGKSYNVTREIIKHQKEVGLVFDEEEYNSDYVYRTTIYPEYSYYDFIGNIMPIVNGEKITYDFKPGIFTLALAKALETAKYNIPVYLVIEEISRGNIASIFGDIFQLLDRGKTGISEYKIDNDIIANYLATKEIAGYKLVSEDNISNRKTSNKKEIYLPSNFNILGTVNTSDQNVFVMDTAFKRRFEFEYVDITPVKDNKTKEYLNEYKFILQDFRYSWNDFYQKLNNYIVSELELPEDKQIGQFFIKFDKGLDDENYRQIQNKLLQYLWEDVHLINITENYLFKEEYKYFSKLYEDFGKHINVFNKKFIESVYKEPVSNDELEDNGEGSLEENEEV